MFHYPIGFHYIEYHMKNIEMLKNVVKKGKLTKAEFEEIVGECTN